AQAYRAALAAASSGGRGEPGASEAAGIGFTHGPVMSLAAKSCRLWIFWLSPHHARTIPRSIMTRFPCHAGREPMFRRIVITLTLAAAGLAQDKAQDKPPVPDKDGVARMEQVVQSFVPKQFMGTVLVAQDGKVLLDKGYGFANLEWEIPNSPTTKFRLGSITKQFTAASILLLEERGMLKVEDPV